MNNINSGVYVILNETKSTEDKLYIKIGCSKDYNKRFKQICKSYKFNGSLDKLSILITIPCVRYKELEKKLHQIMQSRKITNEGFFTEEDFLNNRLHMIDLSCYNKII